MKYTNEDLVAAITLAGHAINNGRCGVVEIALCKLQGIALAVLEERGYFTEPPKVAPV